MTFYDRVESFAMASDAAADFDGLVKVAEDSGVTVNDLIVHHNLTKGNLFTGENLIKIAEEVEPSALLGAVNVFEKMASDDYSDEDAMAELASYGLEVEDYEKVAEALNGQIEEIALDRDLDKVAEAHAFLEENGIDPVSAITLITDLNNVGTPEEGEKVASEYSDLDADMEDKLAQVQNFLMDLEVVHPEDAMIAYDKEAASLKGIVDGTVEGAKNLYTANVTKDIPKKIYYSAKKAVTRTLKQAKGGEKKHYQEALDAIANKEVKQNGGFKAVSEKSRKLKNAKKGLENATLKTTKARKRLAVAAGGTGAAAGGAAYAYNRKRD